MASTSAAQCGRPYRHRRRDAVRLLIYTDAEHLPLQFVQPDHVFQYPAQRPELLRAIQG